MTEQEIFNIAARHLLTQGRRSMRDGVCAYRGEGGLKCAIGPFIPDEFYDPSMEGQNLFVVAWLWKEPFTELDSSRMNLLTRLQRLHDGVDPCDWREHLNRLALKRGLSTAVLDEVAR